MGHCRNIESRMSTLSWVIQASSKVLSKLRDRGYAVFDRFLKFSKRFWEPTSSKNRRNIDENEVLNAGLKSG